MAGYTKLFSSILASTIWRAPDKTRIVWITLLAMADKNGVAEGSIPGLADLARVTVEDCEAALAELSAPDRYSRSKEQEGRRIEEVEGGWRLINHGKYRATMNADERREYLRKKQAEHRQKVKKSRQQPVNKRSELSTPSTHASPSPSPSTDTKEKKEEDVVTSSLAFRENAEPPTTTPGNGNSAPPIPEPLLDPELRTALEATTWLRALIQPATTSWWSKLLTLYEPVAELYVFDELAKADLWLEAHPDRRPRSLRGQQQFVANWLRKAEADAHKLAAGMAAARRTYGAQP